ncbi:hypothetical protein FACS189464_2740 [Bacteroidia bacterium]|nr:hypothetical protein FACS189464_2740 [Bacteroidia bacterium]
MSDDTTVPGQVSNIELEPLPGAVKISYTLPEGQSLSYVKAECLINGVVRQVKASSYVNYLTIEGFADESEYTVNLYSVNRSEKASAPVATQVTPLSPNFREVRKNIQLRDNWGGATVIFENPNQADLAITLTYVDSTGFWNAGETYYTKSTAGQFSLRGLPADETTFGVYVRDHWGNISDTLVKNLTPRFEKQLDKSKFAGMSLPGDAPLTAGFEHQYWWNGIMGGYAGQCLATLNTGLWPQAVTFDMHVPEGALLSRMKLWGRQGDAYLSVAYNDRSPSKFEIWGSMDPNPDGSWDSWTLLLDGEIIKPSGSPVGTNSDEDMEAWINGNDVEFPLDIPYVRYIRFICKETWGKVTTIFLTTELSLWGQEPSDIQ